MRHAYDAQRERPSGSSIADLLESLEWTVVSAEDRMVEGRLPYARVLAERRGRRMNVVRRQEVSGKIERYVARVQLDGKAVFEADDTERPIALERVLAEIRRADEKAKSWF